MNNIASTFQNLLGLNKQAPPSRPTTPVSSSAAPPPEIELRQFIKSTVDPLFSSPSDNIAQVQLDSARLSQIGKNHFTDPMDQAMLDTYILTETKKYIDQNYKENLIQGINSAISDYTMALVTENGIERAAGKIDGLLDLAKVILPPDEFKLLREQVFELAVGIELEHKALRPKEESADRPTPLSVQMWDMAQSVDASVRSGLSAIANLAVEIASEPFRQFNASETSSNP